MAFFAEDPKPAFSNRLALFHNLPTDAGVEQTESIDVRRVGSTSHGGVIEFNLSAATTCNLDLLRTRLFLRARILHDDGTVLKPKEKVGFVNLALQSLWNQVDISVQQQVISPLFLPTMPTKRIFMFSLNTEFLLTPCRAYSLSSLIRTPWVS